MLGYLTQYFKVTVVHLSFERSIEMKFYTSTNWPGPVHQMVRRHEQGEDGHGSTPNSPVIMGFPEAGPVSVFP